MSLSAISLPRERSHQDLLATLKAMRHGLGLGDEVCAITRSLNGQLRLHRPRELSRGQSSLWLTLVRRAIVLRDLLARDPSSPITEVLRPGTSTLLVSSPASVVAGVRALATDLGCRVVGFPPDLEIELLLEITRRSAPRKGAPAGAPQEPTS